MITCKQYDGWYQIYYPTKEARRFVGANNPDKQLLIREAKLKSIFPNGGYSLTELLKCPIDDGYIDDIVDVNVASGMIGCSVQWLNEKIAEIDGHGILVVFDVDGTEMLRKYEIPRIKEKYEKELADNFSAKANARFRSNCRGCGTVEELLKDEQLFVLAYNRFIEYGIIPKYDYSLKTLDFRLQFIFAYKLSVYKKQRLKELWKIYREVYTKSYAKSYSIPTEAVWRERILQWRREFYRQ